jgi:hypothetical protein
MPEHRMSVRELKLVLDGLPNESLLVYNAGINQTSFQQVLKIEIPFQATKKKN